MGNIGITNQCDHWWGGVDHIDRTHHLLGSITTGIRVRVCNQIGTWNEVIDRAIGICGTITIDGVIPSCSCIHIFRTCFMSNIGIAHQGDDGCCVINVLYLHINIQHGVCFAVRYGNCKFINIVEVVVLCTFKVAGIDKA